MGEFSDLNGRKSVVEQLRGLTARAWAAIGVGVIVLLLIVAAIAGPGTPSGTTAAASRPLPMTPTGGYTVGEQYYAGKVAMPNYVGWTLQAAVNDLASRGIRVGTFDPVYATSIIQSQNPYPGTRISQDNANVVQLLVPEVAPTTTTTRPSTTTTTPPVQPDVDVEVDDDTNLPDGALTGGYCRKKWWC